MKDYRTLANPSAQIARLIELPGIRDLEGVKHMNDMARVREDFNLDDRVDALSRKLFGIAESDTRYALPDDFDIMVRTNPIAAYQIEDAKCEFDEQFFCDSSQAIDDQCAYLFGLGWDLTDAGGHPMRLFDRFARQVEAAARGLVGARLPDMQAIHSENWEANMAEAARKHMNRKRSG